jgi:hypothetical protein
VITEKEILVTPCICQCCHVIEGQVGGLSPGWYEVWYCWRDAGAER